MFNICSLPNGQPATRCPDVGSQKECTEGSEKKLRKKLLKEIGKKKFWKKLRTQTSGGNTRQLAHFWVYFGEDNCAILAPRCRQLTVMASTSLNRSLLWGSQTDKYVQSKVRFLHNFHPFGAKMGRGGETPCPNLGGGETRLFKYFLLSSIRTVFHYELNLKQMSLPEKLFCLYLGLGYVFCKL